MYSKTLTFYFRFILLLLLIQAVQDSKAQTQENTIISLTLTPVSRTKTVKERHCVQAKVEAEDIVVVKRVSEGPLSKGKEVEGTLAEVTNLTDVEAVRIQFSVSGANFHSETIPTGAEGVAEFCYVGLNIGTDQIIASAQGYRDTSEVEWKEFFSCEECLDKFSPDPGVYALSAWVKEEYIGTMPSTYSKSGIRISFKDGAVVLPLMRPSGPIIEGWQRIEQMFVIGYSDDIQIELVNESPDRQAYFDDVRIYPYHSNMKSYVYNPATQRLVAELDENNYATLFEYDEEGILTRVKKETERGVMTLRESRGNKSKIKP